MARLGRKQCLRAILEGSKGSLDAFIELLETDLEDADRELETAADNVTIWRAQGRAQELRELLGLLAMRGRLE